MRVDIQNNVNNVWLSKHVYLEVSNISDTYNQGTHNKLLLQLISMPPQSEQGCTSIVMMGEAN